MNNAVDLAERLLARYASYEIRFERDAQKRQYVLETNILASSAKTFPLTEEQIYTELIPSGSQWSHLLGWRSFFAIPLLVGSMTGGRGWVSQPYIALGVETVAPHPETGASLVYRAYLFPAEQQHHVIENLTALVHAVERQTSTERHQRNIRVPRNGILQTDAPTPRSYQQIERALIVQAIHQYRQNEPYLLRTLIVSGVQYEQTHRLPNKLIGVQTTLMKKFPLARRHNRGCLGFLSG
ncbi:MAG: hypothetical protein AAF639_37070 [Chloroflexota bacterium]